MSRFQQDRKKPPYAGCDFAQKHLDWDIIPIMDKLLEKNMESTMETRV